MTVPLLWPLIVSLTIATGPGVSPVLPLPSESLQSPPAAQTLSLTRPVPAEPLPREAAGHITIRNPFNYHRGTTLLLWTGVSLGAMDISRTMYEIGQGTVYEQNPILRPYVHSPEKFAVMKLTGNAAVTAYLSYVNRTHPKSAFWGALMYNAVSAAVVIHNYRTTTLH